MSEAIYAIKTIFESCLFFLTGDECCFSVNFDFKKIYNDLF